ncbi:hypothetical protein ACTXT7_005706 [Hymenolepis weldensis]
MSRCRSFGVMIDTSLGTYVETRDDRHLLAIATWEEDEGGNLRTGAACMSGIITTPGLEEVINEIRQNKADSQVSRMDHPKQQWLDAISTCNLFEIQEMLKEDPGLINWKNPCDGTALHYAAKEGNVKCLNYLMQCGDIDVNAQCGVCFISYHPLMFAFA